MTAKRGRPKKQAVAKYSNITPMPGYALIEPVEAETKTKSGIYLPDSASEEKPLKGQVVAIGEDEVTEHGVIRKCPVKVGALVIYKKWGGNEVKIEGKELLFTKFEDILATLN